LTEYGAIRAVWFAHHTADPKGRPRGCCFLPRLGNYHDRFEEVHYGAGTRVDLFEMFFFPHIRLGYARQVVRHEAGPGAQLVYDRTTADCEYIEYRSALFSRAIGKAMEAVLYGDLSDAPPGGQFGVAWIIVRALPYGQQASC
jgi:hypothetical protein